MPRQRGIGMRKPKKKRSEQSGTAPEDPSATPDTSELPAPPSPPRKPSKPQPPSSPGLKAAKAAAYDSQKAAQVARRARTIAHRSCADYKAYTGRYWRKIKGIQRDFEAAAKDPPHTQHKWLQRVLQAELLWNQKYSGTLLHVVVAYGASVEAKNAKIAALEARLARGGSPQSAVRMRRRI